MTEHRNIITVDGRQVAILDKSGIISRHELIQYKYLYAKKHNIQYRSAWNRFKAGKIPNAKMFDGHVVIEEVSPFSTNSVVIYARVSSSENKSNLEANSYTLACPSSVIISSILNYNLLFCFTTIFSGI